MNKKRPPLAPVVRFKLFIVFCGYGNNLVFRTDVGVRGGANYFDEAEW